MLTAVEGGAVGCLHDSELPFSDIPRVVLMNLASKLFVLSVSLLLAPMVTADCEGQWTPSSGHQCVQACDGGCTMTTVMTSIGTGRACVCAIVGPHPDCCRLASVPQQGGGSSITHSGDCSSSGCEYQQGSGCVVHAVVVDDVIVFAWADCL